MEGLETVTSAADLSASFPADAAADTGADVEVSEPGSPDNEGADVEFESLNDQGAEETEDPSPDDILHEEPVDEEAEIVAPADAAAAVDELPEGVRAATDRNGKPEMRLTPQRYEKFHGAHKTVRELESIAGEPVTPELFDTYNRAYMGQEKLYGDLLSGDPKAVSSVLSHFLQEGARALNDGEVGADPIVPLAQTFYSQIQASHPEAYAALRIKAGTDLVQEMYAEAAQSGNKNLWLATGHIAKTLGLPFKKSDEMEGFARVQTDPVRTLQQENQQLRAKLDGRNTNNQAAQLDTWHTANKQGTLDAILNEAITPALSDIQAAWAKIPGGKEAYKDLVQDRLHSQVLKTMSQDTRFEGRMKMLRESAARATSAQRRNEIGEQLKLAHIHRANLAVESLKPEVVKFAANAFKERNAATHQRRANAANHRAPGGSGTPVRRSLVPAGFDFEDATVGNLTASLKGLFS